MRAVSYVYTVYMMCSSGGKLILKNYQYCQFDRKVSSKRQIKAQDKVTNGCQYMNIAMSVNTHTKEL